MTLTFRVPFGSGIWTMHGVKSCEYMEGRNNRRGPHWFVRKDGGFMMHVWKRAYGPTELIRVEG